MKIRRACGNATVLTALALTACGPTAQSESTVQAWLECEPCDAGQLDDVVAIPGLRAIPRLAGALRGPTAIRLTPLRRRLGAAWSRMATGGTAADSAAYVQRYVDSYVTQIRTRATLALGAIGRASGAPIASWRARRELQEALVRHQAGSVPLEPQVRSLIRKELSFAWYSPFTGGISATTVAFLDTVEVTPPAGPWAANANVWLSGAPFPNDVLVSRTSNSLRFVAAGPVGAYAAVVDEGGGASGVSRAALRIGSYAYDAHDDSDAPDLVPAGFPQTHLFGLTGLAESPGGDEVEGQPVDRFRFVATVANLDITARLSWKGDSQIVPEWHECPVPGPGIAGEASGRVVDEVGVPVPGALIQVIGQPVIGSSDPFGDFTIPVAAGQSTVRVGVSLQGRVRAERTLVNGTVGHFINLPHSWAILESPIETSITVPAGECRLLKVVKLDPVWGPEIVRLELRAGPGDPSALVFLQSSATVTLGTGVQPSLLIRDAGGDYLAGRTALWSSSDPAIASVDPTGFIRTLAAGTVTITATVGSMSSSITLTVQ